MARREETTRLCALTRVEKPVAELIRFVLGPDDEDDEGEEGDAPKAQSTPEVDAPDADEG